MSDYKLSVIDIFEGWDRKLRNAIYHFLQTRPNRSSSETQGSPEQIKEPITYVRKAQVSIC